jgi:hypothetical protein
MKTARSLVIFYLGYLILGASVAGAAPSGHQIKVTLFDQPCILQGPVDEATLKTIHSISPEQIHPTFSLNESSTSVKSCLDKLRAIKEVPSALDTYREQLTKRLEAEAAFLKGIEAVNKYQKSEGLIAPTKSFLPAAKQKTFEALASKLEAKNLSPAQRKETIQNLFNTYSDAMPTDPEEEFHRAIHKLKVQYVCTFEGNESEGGDE